MIYSQIKYISKTQIIKSLFFKKDFSFFQNQESIIIDYRNCDYTLFHIEDVYSIIKLNNLKINTLSDSFYKNFFNAIYLNENIEFKFISSFRYCKDIPTDVMIDKESLEAIIIKNKNFKEYYDSLKCFTIKNKIFFDTENLIELLLDNKLTLSTKEYKLLNDIKKIIMYYKLSDKISDKIKITNNNFNRIKI